MPFRIAGGKFVAGKVLIGPKVIGDGYYRLVAQRDHSGRIERFDTRTRRWEPAPEDVTFTDVWKAAPVSQLFVDMACIAPAGDEEAGEEQAVSSSE